MQAVSSTSEGDESKAIAARLGRDPTAIVRAYTPATVDIAFLRLIFEDLSDFDLDGKKEWQILEGISGDIEIYLQANIKTRDYNYKEIKEALDFYRSRGYDIKGTEDVLHMLMNHPITLDTNLLILNVKWGVEEPSVVVDEKENITVMRPENMKRCTLRNWANDKIIPPSRPGLYVRDFKKLLFYMRKHILKSNEWISKVLIEDVRYNIDPILGPIISVDVELL